MMEATEIYNLRPPTYCDQNWRILSPIVLFLPGCSASASKLQLGAVTTIPGRIWPFRVRFWCNNTTLALLFPLFDPAFKEVFCVGWRLPFLRRFACPGTCKVSLLSLWSFPALTAGPRSLRAVILTGAGGFSALDGVTRRHI